MNKAVNAGMSRSETMQLSVREVRMIVERILLAVRVPQGFIPDVRDGIMYSHAMGLGGLSLFQRRFVAAPPLELSPMTIEGGDTLDGAGNHAWMVAPSAIDLAIASRRNGGGALMVRNVHDIAELELLEGFAGRYGVCSQVTRKGDTAIVEVTEDNNAPDRVLETVLARGMPVPPALWQELYAFSHKALAKDSVVSRRHAGPVMVDAEGRVHGRDDDDSDFAFLFPDTGAKAVQEKV